MCLLLAVALCDMPYGYYRFLRIAIFVWGLYTIFATLRHSRKTVQHEIIRIVVIGVTILYNPVFPISLDRYIWSVLNVLSIPVILAAAWVTVAASESERRR